MTHKPAAKQTMASANEGTDSADSSAGFGRLVSEHRVHRSIYLDEAVFQAELESIFGRSWIFVGHQSQVPTPGSFTTSWIGQQPFILTRDLGGEVRVLFNRCSHRASTVCQERCGTCLQFRCDYHGWTFRLDGRLIGPTFADGYDDIDFDIDDYALSHPNRVEKYRGFVFASLSDSGPSLRDHLGNAAAYIDLFLRFGSHRGHRCWLTGPASLRLRR